MLTKNSNIYIKWNKSVKIDFNLGSIWNWCESESCLKLYINFYLGTDIEDGEE